MPMNFRIHEVAVQSFNLPGQPVNDLIWDVSRNARDIAKAEAPKRTGKLARSIRANRPKPTGLLRLAGYVGANAKHAVWVHDGTGRIFAKRGKLSVPRHRQHAPNFSGGDLRKQWRAEKGWRGGGKPPYFLTMSVRGQKPQPYLQNAIGKAMAMEPRLTATRF